MVTHDPAATERLRAISAPAVAVTVDGRVHSARLGETVLTVLRVDHGHARQSEFANEKRAGFCLMGACQDCWLWHEDGRRLRACTSPAEDGMRLTTVAPESL